MVDTNHPYVHNYNLATTTFFTTSTNVATGYSRKYRFTYKYYIYIYIYLYLIHIFIIWSWYFNTHSAFNNISDNMLHLIVTLDLNRVTISTTVHLGTFYLL